MSCCGNNKVDLLKQIYSQSIVTETLSGSIPISTKPMVGKGSPFSNTADYKPVMSSNGKFVKYIREPRKKEI